MNIVISAATWYKELEAEPDDLEARVRQVAPDAQIVMVPAGGDVSPHMPQAEVFFPLSGSTVTPEVITAAKNLKWLQLASAGVEHAMMPELVESDIVVTNAAGVYGIPIAEHVIGMMLALTRRIPAMVRQQDAREWKETSGTELYEGTVLVLGLGGIGREVARRCRGMGMRVLATRRRPENPDPDAEHVYGHDELDAALPQADWLIVCAPATPETRSIIGQRQLDLMKPGARIVNIARGSLIDEQALIEALRDGRLAGAALDVFEEEPLPAESPLWSLPNVLVSPHTSGSSPRSVERAQNLFLENLRRYQADEDLLNVVDKQAGY
jgi:phosphoglycerate dehydrogenase-like enzyme